MIYSTKDITYYRNILKEVASRMTCDRALIGAIIVRGKVLISTGYGGAPSGLSHCDEVGHLMYDDHCVRTTHAELNAILSAARNGININGADMFCTHKPCYNCMKALINSGIKHVYYFEQYRDDYQQHFEDNPHCEFHWVVKKESPIGKRYVWNISSLSKKPKSGSKQNKPNPTSRKHAPTTRIKRIPIWSRTSGY